MPKLEDAVITVEGTAYNYFIELSNYELVASSDPEARTLRGMWIVQQDNRIGFQFFIWVQINSHIQKLFGLAKPVIK